MERTLLFGQSAFSVVAHIPSLTTHYKRGQRLFFQGDAANSLYLLTQGEGMLVISSADGKESTVHMVRPGEFFGEDCLAATGVRTTSAVAGDRCAALRFKSSDILVALREDPRFSEAFFYFLLQKEAQAQAAIVEQFFNSSEQRLARVLLSMAEEGLRTAPSVMLPPVTQAALAEQVGTTRSRISFFMNRFRKLGLIDYDVTIRVFASLTSVIPADVIRES